MASAAQVIRREAHREEPRTDMGIPLERTCPSCGGVTALVDVILETNLALYECHECERLDREPIN